MRLIKLVATFALVALVQFYLCAAAGTQTRPTAIVGGTLIDWNGRPAVEDAAIVIRDRRFQGVGMPEQRWQRNSIIVRTEEEARKAVRAHVERGMDGFKFFERLLPEVAKAAADEARRLGRPVIAHSVDIFSAVDAGYTSVEYSWAVMFTTIREA